MKILLVGPSSKEAIFSHVSLEIPYLSTGTKGNPGTDFTPNALATVAALTPPQHDVHVHDEQIRGPVEPLLERIEFEIIGISAIATEVNRSLRIAEFCKNRGLRATVVIGGPGVANLPKGLHAHADVLFFGEAEETWPQFLREFETGDHKPLYHQISKPDMSKTPIPRWELIREDIPAYGAASVQTARGCPFDCVFCDVVYIYGRRIRAKPIDQVLEEVRLLHGMGAQMILFADNNFATDKRYAKDLLRRLVVFNNALPIPLGYVTQTDITIAEDDELLELMADSNFMEVLIGIESLDETTLRSINKAQNLRIDVRKAVRKIQSYGIPILCSMVIGTDSDETSTFGQIEKFLSETHILDYGCHPLAAPEGTKFWYQLKREGRLIRLREGERDRLDVLTNVIPKRMTRVELMEGLADHLETIYEPSHYVKRAIGCLRAVTRTPNVKQPGFRALWGFRKVMMKMFWYYLFQVPRDHRKAFFKIVRTTLGVAPSLLPKMMFIHTLFTIGHKRSRIIARIAREQAQWERTHPDEIIHVEPWVPIPPQVRESAGEIFAAAYHRVRPRISDREALYKVVVEAMIDYIERFGESFRQFDELQRGHVETCCDRVLAHLTPTPSGEDIAAPEDRPPSGFTRDILDAVDHAIRIRASATV